MSDLFGFLVLTRAAHVGDEPLFDTEHSFLDPATFLPGEGDQAIVKECALWEHDPERFSAAGTPNPLTVHQTVAAVGLDDPAGLA
ncbi:hypothetical protein SYNGFB01_04295 [Synechococcus sp. GFB01]|nr:hypothetical protein SYNGFB01_04295 [Synechococcus sp. GFB01]